MNKILVRVSNGTKIHIENVSHLIEEKSDKSWYRKIKIKETELENYKDHFIYDWSEDFFSEKSLPEWIYKSQLLEFEIVYE